MKKLKKSILAAAVTLTVTASGVGAYFRFSKDTFRPEDYAKNAEFNRNQVTFDGNDSSEEYADSSDSEEKQESRQWEQDNNAEQKMHRQEQPDKSVLLENQNVPNAETPTLLTPQAFQDAENRGLLSDTAEAGGSRNAAYVLDNDGGSTGTAAAIVAGSGTGTGVVAGTSGSGSTTGSTSGRNHTSGSGTGGSSAGGGSASTPSGEEKPSDDDNSTDGNTNVPSQPDTPEQPTYKNDYVEPEPEQPAGIYDNFFAVRPFPSAGLDSSAADTAKLYAVPLNSVEEADLIYYGQKLDPWKLLCASNVHVEYRGVFYRVTELNENFRITDFPETAKENFTATFSLRLNANSQWLSVKVDFEVMPYKLVLSDYNHRDAVNDKYSQYPEAGKPFNILKYYGRMYRDDRVTPQSGTPITSIFLGWSENNGGEPIYYEYTPSHKGLTALYPLGTVPLPEEFQAEVVGKWTDDSTYCFVQQLTGYTGKSREITVPEGLQTVALTGEADSITIPNSVFEVADSLSVQNAYTVAEDNQYLCSVDGVLFRKDMTVLCGVPCAAEELTVPETVGQITLPEKNHLRSLTLSMETPPEMELEKLHGATIYVPDSAYMQYVKQWLPELGDNQLKPQSAKDTVQYYTKDNAILTDIAGGTRLCGVTEQVTGIYAVPEGVTEIQADAFHDVSLDVLILPSTLEKLDSKALEQLEGTRIYLQGTTVPAAEADSFPEEPAGVYVLPESAEAYQNQWNAYGLALFASEFAVCESGGYTYFQEKDGVTLLKTPAELEHFQSDSLPDVTIKAIGSYAFANSPNLQTAELPAETKYLYPSAFRGCASLECLVSLSEDYIQAGENAFADCSGLFCIAMNAESGQISEEGLPEKNCHFYRPYDSYGYASRFLELTFRYQLITGADGVSCLYGNSGTEQYLTYVTSNLSGEITLESGTTSIASGAFSHCQNPFTVAEESFRQLSFIDTEAFDGSGISGELVFAENLWLMGDNAFRNCTNLTGVTFATGSFFTAVPTCAFSGCTSLESVTFAEGQQIQRIGICAFEDTALRQITIPETVTELYYSVFAGCPALEEIAFAGTVPPALIMYGQDTIFSFGDDGSTLNPVPLTVPEGMRETYWENWQYLYAGFASLYDMCDYYYRHADGTEDEVVEAIAARLQETGQALWELLGGSGTVEAPDREQIRETLKEAEEDEIIW